jgi:hypothetical protein
LTSETNPFLKYTCRYTFLLTILLLCSTWSTRAFLINALHVLRRLPVVALEEFAEGLDIGKPQSARHLSHLGIGVAKQVESFVIDLREDELLYGFLSIAAHDASQVDWCDAKPFGIEAGAMLTGVVVGYKSYELPVYHFLMADAGRQPTAHERIAHYAHQRVEQIGLHGFTHTDTFALLQVQEQLHDVGDQSAVGFIIVDKRQMSHDKSVCQRFAIHALGKYLFEQRHLYGNICGAIVSAEFLYEDQLTR